MNFLYLYKFIIQIIDKSTKQALVIGTLILVFSSFLELLGLGIIFPVVQLLTVDNLIQENEIIGFISKITGINDPINLSIAGIAFIAASIFIKSVIGITGTYWLGKILVQEENKFSSRLFEAYLKAPITWHHNNNSSDILYRIRSCTSMIYESVLGTLMQWLADTVFILGLIIVLVIASPEAAFTSIFFGAIGFIVVEYLLRNASKSYSLILHNAYTADNKLVFESMQGISEIRILARESHFKKLFDDLKLRIGKIRYLSKTLLQAPRYIFEVFTAIFLLTVFLFLINNYEKEEVVALLALYGLAAIRLMPTVARLITTLNTVRLASQGINALRKDYQDLHEWFPKADSQSVPAQLRRQVAFKDLIDLQNISFEYLPKNPVINDISIQIKKGQSIGIAGPSGAGKSTLIGILLGILKPSNGHILVDGVNLNPSLSAYERSIGLVPQHVFLADDTIKANIAFGIEPSKIDLKRISKALLDARLYEFVATLPEGIETLIGEQGVRLSGGQRQRLGIARALYDDPDILILDEATSSLDLETESKITDVMTSLHGTKTLVIIAHRLSTIQSCDEIYYMKDGGIAEKGTFLELTTKNEEFKRLVHLGQLQT